MADKTRTGWTTVAFGDIAEPVNDRVDDPATAGVDRYVGLEHLDADSLTIRRWGSTEDVSSTKLRFGPGDIIFGKRRVYQRKLAVADFHGICSAHALVLRAKPEAVLPEFLPYFMQSDYFMEAALKISVGSLSPTINWKTLAQYEFNLPPVGYQKSLTATLSAAAELRDRYKRVQHRLTLLKRAVFHATLTGGEKSRATRWGSCRGEIPIVRLGDVCSVKRGASPRPKGNPLYFSADPTPYHWIKISDLALFKVGAHLTSTTEFLTAAGAEKSRIVTPGSLLLTNCATVGVPVFSAIQGCIHYGYLVFDDFDDSVTDTYLYRLFEYLTPWFKATAQTGTQANLNTGILQDLEVPLIAIADQSRLADLLSALESMNLQAGQLSSQLGNLQNKFFMSSDPARELS